MSYETVLAGLHERFATVEGIVNILDYVPSSIQATPTLYSVFDHLDVSKSGQVITYRWRIQHRLLVRWQDNEQAEAEIVAYIDDLIEAVDADPHLGGALTAGYAQITEVDGGWVTVGGGEYRVLDFISTVVEK